MSIPVMILGETGTGKSASLRNMNPETTLLIRTVNKPLPFRSTGWNEWDTQTKTGSIVTTDNWNAIARIIKAAPDFGKSTIVIDDFQYLLANEFMRRSSEKGYEKFTEIGVHAWEVLQAAQMNNDVRVYFLGHTHTDEFGNTKAKTIGKLLDDKITIEGLFTIVMRTAVSDGNYFFSTKNNGKDTVKTPMGLFDDSLIENDLQQIDNQICQYYNINKQEIAA